MKTRLWHMIVAKSILWGIRGASVIKARPDGGKYIPAQQLPEHVRSAFDVSDDGKFIQSFTSDDAIKTYTEHGATVKQIFPGMYKISFAVSDYRKRINPSAKERAKEAWRDDLGRFISAKRRESQ